MDDFFKGFIVIFVVIYVLGVGISVLLSYSFY